jgi:hypothetical protein
MKKKASRNKLEIGMAAYILAMLAVVVVIMLSR